MQVYLKSFNFKEVGHENVFSKSLKLAKTFLFFRKEYLKKYLSNINDSVILLDWKNPIRNLPYEYYQELHNSNIHSKFIKISKKSSTIYRLRFGLPYYESEERLNYAVERMVAAMVELLKK